MPFPLPFQNRTKHRTSKSRFLLFVLNMFSLQVIIIFFSIFPDFSWNSPKCSFSFPWLENVISNFQVFQTWWEPCKTCYVAFYLFLGIYSWISSFGKTQFSPTVLWNVQRTFSAKLLLSNDAARCLLFAKRKHVRIQALRNGWVSRITQPHYAGRHWLW